MKSAEAIPSEASRPANIIIVCGGRDYSDFDYISVVLDKVLQRQGPFTMFQGGANGADHLAKRWAELRGVPMVEFPADWKTHGRAAGPIRNKAMLDAGADQVIAFEGGRGTQNMIRQARLRGIQVLQGELL